MRIWTYRVAESLKTASKRVYLTGKGQHKSHCKAGQLLSMAFELEHNINTHKIAPGECKVCEKEASKSSMDS